MKLSDNGLRLICSFEGYHTKQPDGSCKAYRCPAGVWTCGWGCTEGVDAHTHWTQVEAEEAFRKELDKFEAAVIKHVKVPLNQNEFDALVSFSYNCGEGALRKSGLLKKLNAEKRVEAAQEFRKWTRGGGRVLPGLVARRSREAALFLKPVEAPTEPVIAQKVEAEVKPSRPAVATAAAGAAAAATTVAPSLPPVPPQVTDSIANANLWKEAGEQVWTLKAWALSQPILAAGISAALVIFYVWSKRKEAR